jgi:hypothetical protein
MMFYGWKIREVGSGEMSKGKFRLILALQIYFASVLSVFALSFDFTTEINGAIGTGAYTPAQLTLTGTFTADAAGNLTGFSGTLGGNAVTVNTIGNVGTYNTSTLLFSSLNMSFQTSPALVHMPWTMTFVGNSGGFTYVSVLDTSFLGGTSPSTVTAVPEIDGSGLPKAVLLIGSIFFIMRGRQKAV